MNRKQVWLDTVAFLANHDPWYAKLNLQLQVAAIETEEREVPPRPTRSGDSNESVRTLGKIRIKWIAFPEKFQGKETGNFIRRRMLVRSIYTWTWRNGAWKLSGETESGEGLNGK